MKHRAITLRILLALQRYYVDDITLARAAEAAGVSLWDLTDYMARCRLPIIYEEADAVDGLQRVSRLLAGRGIAGVLEQARAALRA